MLAWTVIVMFARRWLIVAVTVFLIVAHSGLYSRLRAWTLGRMRELGTRGELDMCVASVMYQNTSKMISKFDSRQC
jgi:hypothetical protein